MTCFPKAEVKAWKKPATDQLWGVYLGIGEYWSLFSASSDQYASVPGCRNVSVLETSWVYILTPGSRKYG